MRGLENKGFSKLLLFMDYFLLTKADALPGSFDYLAIPIARNQRSSSP